MKTKPQLTAEQMAALQPLERYFHQAVRANYCSWPGQANIDIMVRTWEALTGTRYPMRSSCSTCILNLVRDLGTIYLAQEKPVEEPKVEKVGKTTPAKRKAGKRKGKDL